jgi:hypothetical protein
VAVIFLTSGKASMAITSPSTGSRIDGNSVKVRISLSGPGGVDKVEVFVDSEKRATIKAAPYQVTLESVDNGRHVLEASAVDANGSVLARASGTFTSRGKTDEPPDGGQTGDEESKVHKAALASKINLISASSGAATTRALKLTSVLTRSAIRVTTTPRSSTGAPPPRPASTWRGRRS